MKQSLFSILLLWSFSGFSQIFTQDFSSSTSVNSYVGSGVNQFSQISSFGNSPASITDGALRWSKKGGSSAYFVRTTNIAPSTATFLKTSFKLRVNVPAVIGDNNGYDAAFYIGSGEDVGWTNTSAVTAPVSDSTHSRVPIKLHITPTTAKFSIYDGVEYSGWNTITIFSNNTGSEQTYSSPNGATSSVADNKFDVWIGGTVVMNDASGASPRVGLDKFKLIYPSGAPNSFFEVDDISFYGQTVLPVALTSFSAEKEMDGIALKWTTASEKNNSHFQLLHANNSDDFSELTRVSGKGSTDQISNYKYLDSEYASGVNYYKLVQVDADGTTTTYPQILAVNSTIENEKLNLAYFDDELKVDFISAKSNSNGKAIINDVTGKIILSKSLNITSGQNTVQLPVALSRGVYVLTLINGTEKTAVKFIY